MRVRTDQRDASKIAELQAENSRLQALVEIADAIIAHEAREFVHSQYSEWAVVHGNLRRRYDQLRNVE